jgi:hypothetical protein
MASLKKCIEEKCKDCTYDKADDGTWRDQVERCNVRSCALWPVRPLTVATINLIRKNKAASGVVEIDVDALVDALPDEEDDTAAVA